MQVVSNRGLAAAASFEPFRQFLLHSRYTDRRHDPGICDLTFGNPHEMPLPGLVDAIRQHAVPHNKDWFAYKTSEPEPQAFLAERLSQELSQPFEPADIALTTGAMAAIAVAFHLLLNAGDEVIFPTPAWFFYESMLRAADAVPKKVKLQGERFDLDLSAIDEAISPRTRLVIINTPQ
jgi:aspartate aminotransferase